MIDNDNEDEGSVDNLVTLTRKRWKQSESSHESWRLSANQSYAFVAGNQLDDATKALYQEKLRPIVAFNMTGKYIDAVSGLELNNRQDATFQPRQVEDSGVNDLATEVVDWARDACDAQDEESDSFWDMLVTGMGWTETFMDYEEDEEGMIVTERRDPQQMRWDTRARKKNLRDTRWLIRGKPMSHDEIEEKWPDADFGEPDEMVDGMEEVMLQPHDATRAPFYEGDTANGGGETRVHTVLEMQWYKIEPFVLVKTEYGEKMIQRSQWKSKFKAFLENNNVQYKILPRKKKVYYRSFTVGTTLLDEGESPCQQGFTYKCMTGKRNRNDQSWYGLTESMKDPQLWVNKMLSQIMHVTDTNAKGGIMAERGAFENPVEAERDWASPDKIVWMEDGSISGEHGKRFQERPQTTYPQGSDRLLEIALKAFSGVTGIPVELLGTTEKVQAGVVEQQRKQAGMAMVAWAFDAKRRHLKDTAALYLEYIQKYMTEGRLVRIAGTDGNKQYIPLVKDSLSAKYDIIVDESPSSVNTKERTWVSLMQLMPMLKGMGINPPPEFLDYTPLPASFVAKWKENMQGDPQKAQEQEQLQQQGIQLEMADKDAKVKLQLAKVGESGAKADNLDADSALKAQNTRKSAAETGSTIAN